MRHFYFDSQLFNLLVDNISQNDLRHVLLASVSGLVLLFTKTTTFVLNLK